MKKLVLGAAVALAGVGVFAAVGLGDAGGRGSELDRDLEMRSAHRVHAPSASAATTGRISKKKKRPKVKYLETAPFEIAAGGRDDSSIECPKKHKALNGYYVTSGGIVPDASAISPESNRGWEFGLLNISGAEGAAIIGLVCGKRL